MNTKLLSFFLLLWSTLNAQISITPNPFSINSGSITLTYGANGDYSLYDPAFNPNLYLYTGLETDGIASTWDYHDTWTDVTSLIPLTWNANANAYVATFDIATRTYFSEFTQSNGLLPAGTTVNNWYFIIRNATGSSQSANIQGSSYGFFGSTLLSKTPFDANSSITIYGKTMQSNLKEKAQVNLFNSLGQQIAVFHLLPNESIPLPSIDKGIYFATISVENTIKRIKFLL